MEETGSSESLAHLLAKIPGHCHVAGSIEAQLARLPKEQRRDVLGELLFEKVLELVCGSVQATANVTGMLLELQLCEQLLLLRTPSALAAKVQEALGILAAEGFLDPACAATDLHAEGEEADTHADEVNEDHRAEEAWDSGVLAAVAPDRNEQTSPLVAVRVCESDSEQQGRGCALVRTVVCVRTAAPGDDAIASSRTAKARPAACCTTVCLNEASQQVEAAQPEQQQRVERADTASTACNLQQQEQQQQQHHAAAGMGTTAAEQEVGGRAREGDELEVCATHCSNSARSCTEEDADGTAFDAGPSTDAARTPTWALGELVFPRVRTLPSVGSYEQACKITGMLLELDPDDVLWLLVHPDQLQARVDEALGLLQAHAAQASLPALNPVMELQHAAHTRQPDPAHVPKHGAAQDCCLQLPGNGVCTADVRPQQVAGGSPVRPGRRRPQPRQQPGGVGGAVGSWAAVGDWSRAAEASSTSTTGQQGKRSATQHVAAVLQHIGQQPACTHTHDLQGHVHMGATCSTCDGDSCCSGYDVDCASCMLLSCSSGATYVAWPSAAAPPAAAPPAAAPSPMGRLLWYPPPASAFAVGASSQHGAYPLPVGTVELSAMEVEDLLGGRVACRIAGSTFVHTHWQRTRVTVRVMEQQEAGSGPQDKATCWRSGRTGTACLAEAHACSALRHPHTAVVRATSTGKSAVLYDDLHGGCLEEILQAPAVALGSLDALALLRVAHHVALALMALNSAVPALVLGPALQPSSVWLDSHGNARLLGLGAAHVQADRGGSDVHALGTLLCKILLGAPYLAADTAVARVCEALATDSSPSQWCAAFCGAAACVAAGMAAVALRLVHTETARGLEEAAAALEELLEQCQAEAKQTSSTPLEPPSAYRCPISQCVMDDPVVTSDGYTYERQEIVAWLQRPDSLKRSPLTNLPLVCTQLLPNRALQDAIHSWRQQHTQFVD